MKTSLVIFVGIISLIAIVACNKKAGSAKEEPVTENPVNPNAGNGSVENPPKEANQILGFQKTACFGKCPVYQVKFYDDGRATWHGKMNVERMGWHETKVSKEEVKRLLDKAQEVGFFDFYNEYPTGQKVADLPSTITFIRIGDMEKSIKNTHDGPEKLNEYQKFLENYITSLPWKPRADE